MLDVGLSSAFNISMCLGTSDNFRINVAPCSDVNSQRWFFTSDNHLYNVGSFLYMDASNVYTDTTTPQVTLRAFSSSIAQSWILNANGSLASGALTSMFAAVKCSGYLCGQNGGLMVL